VIPYKPTLGASSSGLDLSAERESTGRGAVDHLAADDIDYDTKPDEWLA